MSNSLTKRLLKLVQSDLEETSNETPVTDTKKDKNKSNKRKRNDNDVNDDNNNVVTKEDLVNWHIRLLLHTDKQSSGGGSGTIDDERTKKVNLFSRKSIDTSRKRYSTEVIQKLEKEHDKEIKQHNKYKIQNSLVPGSSRTTASIQRKIEQPIPTFDKKVYEQEKLRKETSKLAAKLKLLDKMKKRKEPRKKL